jgi:hypothetical protein
VRGQRKSWAELTPQQRTWVVVGAAVEAVLTTIAARDLATRDASQVRGPKPLWALVLTIQPVGPVAYLVVGRR